MKIAIIDIDVGNTESLYHCVKKIGYLPEVTSNKEKIINSDKIIFPGVGAFNKVYENMKKNNFLEVFNTISKMNKSILCICVGYQVLSISSEENNSRNGLGLVKGKVNSLQNICNNLSIPHVGWNSCKIVKHSALFDEIHDNSDFYFAHSFYLDLNEKQQKLQLTKTKYGKYFTSSIKIGNIYGVQFHPEKSQRNGIKLIKNFIEKC
jgi:glutamine amidotransferase